MRPVRVGVCADYREEGWPSMDRVADELVSALNRQAGDQVSATRVCPPFTRRATRVTSGRPATNVDRGLNRLFDYPRHVARVSGSYDVFHIVDHSYAQLVHRLPPDRTIVTCHDLDTFRSLFHPGEEPRSVLFRAMARHILAGLRRATVVTCDTSAVRDELVARRIVPESRAVVAPIGVGRWFVPEPDDPFDRKAATLMSVPSGAAPLLHVGSSVPRKRLDVLLRCCGALRRQGADVHLVRAGGPFTGEQQRILVEEGLAGHVSVLPPLDDRTLAAVYRRAALVLLPSEREGFGLPLVEALRCGTPAAASDLPALREVGGAAVELCPVGDVAAWSGVVSRLLRERNDRPDLWSGRRERGVAGAGRFSWVGFAAQMAAIYRDVASGAFLGHRIDPVVHLA